MTDFNQNLNVLTRFSRDPKYEISIRCVWWEWLWCT